MFLVDHFWQLHRVDAVSFVTELDASFKDIVQEFSFMHSSNKKLKLENDHLQAKILLLQAELNILRNDVNENKVLKELLGSSSRLDGSFVAAKLVGWVNFEQKIALINKGAKDMVFLGQAVLDGHGVFAQVVEVGAENSKIKMITAAEVTVPIMSISNFRGFAHGSKIGLLIDNVPDTTKFHEGDLIMASGVGGIFPEGYPYGRVTRVNIDRNGKQEVVLNPSARLAASDRLLLFWPDKSIKPPLRI